MLKETITYHDLDNNEITEDFLFNLYPSEVAELNFSVKGGLEGYLKQIIAEEDGEKIIETFKKIILKAYGVRGENNKSFVKSRELTEEFAQTEAFSILFMKLATDEQAAADFINALVVNLTKDHQEAVVAPAKTTKKTTKK